MMTDAPAVESQSSRAGSLEIITQVSMSVLMILVLIRTLSTHEPFPMWDSDPFEFETPIVGLTSGYGVLLNAAMMLAGFIVLITTPITSKADRWIAPLFAIGCFGLCIHLGTNPETVVEGSSLGAMMVTMIASRTFLSNYPGWSKILIPLIIGAGLFLVIYGLHQVYIQHPLTVEMYEQNRDAFLSARGWSDGSFEVLSYERRLRQPEPTGWFGLANVYASFLAAFGIAMVMITLCSLRRAWWVVSGLLAAVFLGLLVISKSKGAIGAAGVGFLVVQYILVRKQGKFSRIGTSTIAASLLIMAGVIAGAMLGQLSLLFRGQYMVGALRIFENHPIFGVGPGQFQDAYMVHKPSTSPEDVTSAHNLLFDLIAQLGIAGIAWVLVFIAVLSSARLPAKTEDDQSSSQHAGINSALRVRIIALIALVAGVGAIRLQSGAIDLEIMLILLVGLGLWILTSVLLSILSTHRILTLSMLGASIVLVLHALLDLTPVWIVSAPLFGMCVGIGFSSPAESTPLPPKSNTKFKLVSSLAIFALIAITGLGASNLINRDRTLIKIAQPAQQIASIKASMNNAEPIQTIADRVSQLSGAPVPPDPLAIRDMLRSIEISQRIQASEVLRRMELEGDSTLTIAALEQTMKAAMAMETLGIQDSDPLWKWVESKSLDLMEQAETFAELKWAGDSLLSVAQFQSSADSLSLSESALSSWIRADALNQNDPKHAIRIMDLLVKLERTDEAGIWAQEAIDRSERMKLDPLKVLSTDSKSRAMSVLMPK
jgi:O-antigen ligase/polysaccharide polymerase Wzy-like membrane protein